MKPLITYTSLLCTLLLCSNCVLVDGFVQTIHNTNNAISRSRPSPYRPFATRMSLNDDDDVYQDFEDFSTDLSDEELFKELRDKKQKAFGIDIRDIDEELRQSTIDTENAFLAAMLEQSLQFKQIKAEQGSDRAVEVFMERIKAEENPGEDVVLDEEDDFDAGKRFAQRMYEEQNPRNEEEDNNTWQ